MSRQIKDKNGNVIGFIDSPFSGAAELLGSAAALLVVMLPVVLLFDALKAILQFCVKNHRKTLYFLLMLPGIAAACGLLFLMFAPFTDRECPPGLRTASAIAWLLVFLGAISYPTVRKHLQQKKAEKAKFEQERMSLKAELKKMAAELGLRIVKPLPEDISIEDLEGQKNLYLKLLSDKKLYDDPYYRVKHKKAERERQRSGLAVA